MIPREVTTNDDFVHWIMNYSKHGAMAQVFVIEAIRHYCEIMSAKEAPKSDPAQIIDPRLWYDLAVEIGESIEEKYNTSKNKS